MTIDGNNFGNIFSANNALKKLLELSQNQETENTEITKKNSNSDPSIDDYNATFGGYNLPEASSLGNFSSFQLGSFGNIPVLILTREEETKETDKTEETKKAEEAEKAKEQEKLKELTELQGKLAELQDKIEEKIADLKEEDHKDNDKDNDKDKDKDKDKKDA